MLYEIINPSDPYTIVAADREIAAVACLLLGEGGYSFEPLDAGAQRDRDGVPLLLFGGADSWCLEQFGRNSKECLAHVLDNRPDALADCLASCLIGRQADREEFEQACALMRSGTVSEDQIAAFTAQRHDRRRTSLNDIGRRANVLANSVRTIARYPLAKGPDHGHG